MRHVEEEQGAEMGEEEEEGEDVDEVSLRVAVIDRGYRHLTALHNKSTILNFIVTTKVNIPRS